MGRDCGMVRGVRRWAQPRFRSADTCPRTTCLSACPSATGGGRSIEISEGCPLARPLLSPRPTSTSPGRTFERTPAMDIQQKLTAFAMMGATWIMWLLVALSVGGVVVALERAIYLIRTSE